MSNDLRVLVTGANGYIGRILFDRLRSQVSTLRGIDVRIEGAALEVTCLDIRDSGLAELLRQEQITHVVHLASIVSPGQDEQLEYDIDVNGTRNVLESCLAANVKHLTVSSSGAAYGYHADNPAWITEQDPLRGNDEFSYSRHKRLVEEMLAEYQQQHPQLQQLILRPGTVLGAGTRNMITRLFTGSHVLALRNIPSPFVFVWDQDLADVIALGVERSQTGAFNVAGDGCVTMPEIAEITGLPLRSIPVWLMKAILTVARPLRLTPFGPEQIRFMQYRPVLSNARLKSEFGAVLRKTSREVLEYFVAQQNESAS